MYNYQELVERLRAGTYTVEELSIILPKASDAIDDLSKQLDDMNEANIALYGALPRWIPLSEKLPEEKTYVLILADTIAGKMAKVSFRYKDSAGNNCWTALDEYGKNLFDWKPTHWMPLPEPPKEEA